MFAPPRVFIMVIGTFAALEAFVPELMVPITDDAMLGLATTTASLCTQFLSISVEVICGYP